jgi:hypothetical protein
MGAGMLMDKRKSPVNNYSDIEVEVGWDLELPDDFYNEYHNYAEVENLVLNDGRKVFGPGIYWNQRITDDSSLYLELEMPIYDDDGRIDGVYNLRIKVNLYKG